VQRIHERQVPFRYFTRHSSDRSLASAEHVEILEAIRAGDAPAAEEDIFTRYGPATPCTVP
jgi:DNA-binding GntR family transcriptional regulator